MDKRKLAEYVATFESVTQLDRLGSLLTLKIVVREPASESSYVYGRV